jgi:hypothetical protein
VDFAAELDPAEWMLAVRCFQKRHLLTHKVGVVDEAYIEATFDPDAVVGRKVSLVRSEIEDLCRVLERLGMLVIASLPSDPK